jgi:hypothetical protein
MSGTDERREVLAGLVERVTFHNEENGFCVLRVQGCASKCSSARQSSIARWPL